MNGRKILKLLLTIATFVAYLYYVINKNEFTLIEIPTALAAASLVYLACSLYGVALEVSRNYIIAAIISIVVIFLFIGAMDKLVSKISWITDDITLIGIMIVSVPCIIRDIRSLVRKAETPVVNCETAAGTVQRESQITSAQQTILKDPKLMMQFSKDYEERKGHKPTYEELVDYINNEAFHIKSAEEIKREVDEMLRR